MTLCGCGISLNNPAEAVAHKDTCGEPQVNLKDVDGLALGLDYSYAFGYELAMPTRRMQAIHAYNN